MNYVTYVIRGIDSYEAAKKLRMCDGVSDVTRMHIKVLIGAGGKCRLEFPITSVLRFEDALIKIGQPGEMCITVEGSSISVLKILQYLEVPVDELKEVILRISDSFKAGLR